MERKGREEKKEGEEEQRREEVKEKKRGKSGDGSRCGRKMRRNEEDDVISE